MTNRHSTSWPLFRTLSRVLGGHDVQALNGCVSAGLLPALIESACLHEMLPALAVRFQQQLPDTDFLDPGQDTRLEQALRNNTLRNMQIKAQSLKLTKRLNQAGINPLFMKGTIALLEAANKDIGFRKQVDIDLLVKPDQLEAAGDVFLADGYSYIPYIRTKTTVPAKRLTTKEAIEMSEAHHHLPPLVKRGYGATVELHRHFLPKEKQGVNPLGPLFDTAHTRECCGAVYLVPSIEYQIIQLILGKFVHDGHLARRSFPLREALDFVCLMESSEKTLNLELLLRHCGHSFTTLSALVPQLMAYTPKVPFAEKNDVSKRIKLMQQRYNSPALAKLLDAHARVLYLANSLAYSPGKLSAYLRRQVSSN